MQILFKKRNENSASGGKIDFQSLYIADPAEFCNNSVYIPNLFELIKHVSRATRNSPSFCLFRHVTEVIKQRSLWVKFLKQHMLFIYSPRCPLFLFCSNHWTLPLCFFIFLRNVFGSLDHSLNSIQFIGYLLRLRWFILYFSYSTHFTLLFFLTYVSLRFVTFTKWFYPV